MSENPKKRSWRRHFLIAFLAMIPLLVVYDFLAKKDFGAAYRSAMKGADRMVVRVDEKGPGDPDAGEIVREIRDPALVAEFASLIECIPQSMRENRIDACGGSALLTFYRGDEKRIVISFHHGESLRWREGDGRPRGVGSNTFLTDASRQALVDWLDRNGVPEPKLEMMGKWPTPQVEADGGESGND